MTREADGWDETKERLRAAVKECGLTDAAREIPCNKTTLFRLLRGDTQAPSLPTQDCIERFLDDRELRGLHLQR